MILAWRSNRLWFGPDPAHWVDVDGGHVVSARRLGGSVHVVTSSGQRWRLSHVGDPARLTLRPIRRRPCTCVVSGSVWPVRITTWCRRHSPFLGPRRRRVFVGLSGVLT
ncbi:MAG: hypothetical protein ACLGIO_14230 [Acidimicrobiia bacterium]